MTRQEMNELIRKVSGNDLAGEIEHQMSIEDREYPYDEVCALLDAESKAESEKYAATLKQARALLIAIGFYRVMPQAEIDSILFSTRSPWNFKSYGIAYTTDFTTEEWFNGVENEKV